MLLVNTSGFERRAMARTKNMNKKAQALRLKERRLKMQAQAIGNAGNMAMRMAGEIDKVRDEAFKAGYRQAVHDIDAAVIPCKRISEARKVIDSYVGRT